MIIINNKVKHINKNIINQLPGNIYCKNLNGVIVWHNHNIIKDFNPKIGIDNLIGKTVNDIFSPKSAKQCHSHDLEILNGPATDIYIKQENLSLINLEIQNYLTITKPLVNHTGNIAGIVVNNININKLHDPLFKTKNLDDYSVFLLQEMIVIINLIKLTTLNSDVKQLFTELQSIAERLLINFNKL